MVGQLPKISADIGTHTQFLLSPSLWPTVVVSAHVVKCTQIRKFGAPMASMDATTIISVGGMLTEPLSYSDKKDSEVISSAASASEHFV